MDGITKTTNFARKHGTLESRLAGIASSLFMERPVTLADDGDASANRDARSVVISRGETAGFAQAGQGGTLTYADPNSESMSPTDSLSSP